MDCIIFSGNICPDSAKWTKFVEVNTKMGDVLEDNSTGDVRIPR